MTESSTSSTLPKCAFNHNDPKQTGPEPFELYARMRADSSVGLSTEYGGFTYFLGQHEIREITRQPELFSSFPNSIPPVALESPLIPLMTDPPDHQGYKQMLVGAFSPQRLAGLLEGPLAEYSRALLDKLAGMTDPDLIEEYCAPIPVFALSRILNVPADSYRRFEKLVMLAVHDTDRPEAKEALAELFGDVYMLVAARNEDLLEDDLISLILTSSVNGHQVTVPEAAGICITLVIAGIDTTQHALANFILLLGQRPDLRGRLIAEPDLMPSAVEELLRYIGPVQSTGRTVMAPCEVGGAPLDPSHPVLLVWAAGNRDPREFDSPEEVRLDRTPNRHLAFGAGIHRCLGSHLARLELRIGLAAFLSRFPEYQVVEDLAGAEHWQTGIVRGPKRLSVRLNATPAQPGESR
jgi:cytochrome P450